MMQFMISRVRALDTTDNIQQNNVEETKSSSSENSIILLESSPSQHFSKELFIEILKYDVLNINKFKLLNKEINKKIKLYLTYLLSNGNYSTIPFSFFQNKVFLNNYLLNYYVKDFNSQSDYMNPYYINSYYTNPYYIKNIKLRSILINPNAIHILEKNLDKINLDLLNISIFKPISRFDYGAMRIERMVIADRIARIVWHPYRMSKWPEDDLINDEDPNYLDNISINSTIKDIRMSIRCRYDI